VTHSRKETAGLLARIDELLSRNPSGEIAERGPLHDISIAHLQLLQLKGIPEPTLCVRYGLKRSALDVSDYVFGELAPQPSRTETISARPLIIIDTVSKGPYAIDLGNRRLFYGEATHKLGFIRSSVLTESTLTNLHLIVGEPFRIHQSDPEDPENPLYIMGDPIISEIILTSSLLPVTGEYVFRSKPDLDIASTVKRHASQEDLRGLPVNPTSLKFFKLMSHVGKSYVPEDRATESAHNLRTFQDDFNRARAQWVRIYEQH
jgi:hypothetical protein